jgi:hypothetical protein
MTGPQRPQRDSHGTIVHPFHDQLPDHSNKRWMSASCPGANHGELKVGTQLLRLGVEIVENFHVV